MNPATRAAPVRQRTGGCGVPALEAIHLDVNSSGAWS